MRDIETVELASLKELHDVSKIVSGISNFSAEKLHSYYMKDIKKFNFYKCLVIKKNNKICGCTFIYMDNYDENTIRMHSFVINCTLKPSTVVSFYKKIFETMALKEKSNPSLEYTEDLFSKGFITHIKKKRHLIYKRFLESMGYRVDLKKQIHFWPFPMLMIFILKIEKV